MRILSFVVTLPLALVLSPFRFRKLLAECIAQDNARSRGK